PRAVAELADFFVRRCDKLERSRALRFEFPAPDRYLRRSWPASFIVRSTNVIAPKDKRIKRHAASIGRPFAEFFRVSRRHMMRFMLTRGESCPGLPQLFRRRAIPCECWPPHLLSLKQAF